MKRPIETKMGLNLTLSVTHLGGIILGKTALVLVACTMMARKLKSEEKKREESVKAFQKWKTDIMEESEDADADLDADAEAEAESLL